MWVLLPLPQAHLTLVLDDGTAATEGVTATEAVTVVRDGRLLVLLGPLRLWLEQQGLLLVVLDVVLCCQCLAKFLLCVLQF